MKIFTAIMLFVSITVSAQESHNGGYNNGSTITCSSIKNHKKTCYADTSGGVKLVKQLSRSSCQNNWGYQNGQIWVDHGCRARFQLYVNGSQGHSGNSGGNYNNNNAGHSNSNTNNNNAGHSNNGNNNQYSNNLIRCESINSNRRTCSIPHGSQVSLYKQLSHSSCSNNWGYNDSSIWVTNGCRADFSLGNKH